MPTRRCVTIPINYSATVAALWAVAVLLLFLHTFAGGSWAAWAVLLGLAASTATLVLVVNRALSVVLDVISWEHQRTRGDVEAPPPAVRLLP